MGRPKRLEDISKTPSAAAEAEWKPGVSKAKNYLSSLPVELQLRIVHYLPCTSWPTICQLDKLWRSVGTVELLRWLLPVSLCKTDEGEIKLCKDLLKRAIRHFIYTNNAQALKRLLDFKPEHPYLRPTATLLLQAEPLTLRARVTKDEEERFGLGNNLPYSSWAVDAAFKFNDMSCMQLLIDHGLTDYSSLLDWAVYDDFSPGLYYGGWLARPLPGADSRGGHNSVLNGLLAYPPRHVVQAMLVMWGRPILHPRLRSLCELCDWTSRDDSYPFNNMLILVSSRGHPASLQTIHELRMMVEILTDDASGAIIAEARQPLSHALRIARGISSMWPGTRHLVAAYLQSVCTWEDNQSCSSGDCSTNNDINNPPLPPAPPLILPSQNHVLHRLIDLKTYDEMLEPKNWLELQYVSQDDSLLWLVSTEFLADEDAARRMRCFKQSLWGLDSRPVFTYSLLRAASACRRWHCVEVVLCTLRGIWPGDLERFLSPDSVLCRAILDAVHGESGCADGRIMRKLLHTGARNLVNYQGIGVGGDVPNDGPFQGSWFGWRPFRLAFVEQQQDREQRETHACIQMREAVLESLSISDQNALDVLVGEPSKALYRASKRRLLRRLAGKRERGKGSGGGRQLWGE